MNFNWTISSLAKFKKMGFLSIIQESVVKNVILENAQKSSIFVPEHYLQGLNLCLISYSE